MKNNLQKSNRKNAGFTLLELVVVVAVMGLISSMAMDVYTDSSNQKRFEATKSRLAEIKFAIIGDPQMRVGSQAVLTGFFNDMGRLPRNIAELITPNNSGFCLHDTDYSVSVSAVNAIDCAAITVGSWSWTPEDSANWKGPYLHNIQTAVDDSGTPNDASDDVGYIAFADAWGNISHSNNFGWIFNATTEISGDFGYLSIQSIGLGAGTGNYEADYPTVSATPTIGEFLIHKVDLDNIGDLNTASLATPAYCVTVATSTINLAAANSAACIAITPALSNIWVVFP
jgi:prepilin-type N-terminal cleavage/methylation domain-containing protein